MELLLPALAALLMGCGVYLILGRVLVRLILGLSMLAYGANLAIFLVSGISEANPPLLNLEAPYVDPLPQALILTAIVIGFGTTALILVLSIRTFQVTGTDEVQSMIDYNDKPEDLNSYANPERPSISPEEGPPGDRS